MATDTPNHDEGANMSDDTTGTASADDTDDVGARTLLRTVPDFESE